MGGVLLLCPGAMPEAGQEETLKFLRHCVQAGLGEGDESRSKGQDYSFPAWEASFVILSCFSSVGTEGVPCPASHEVGAFVQHGSSQSVLRGLPFDSVSVSMDSETRAS